MSAPDKQGMKIPEGEDAIILPAEFLEALSVSSRTSPTITKNKAPPTARNSVGGAVRLGCLQSLDGKIGTLRSDRIYLF